MEVTAGAALASVLLAAGVANARAGHPYKWGMLVPSAWRKPNVYSGPRPTSPPLPALTDSDVVGSYRMGRGELVLRADHRFTYRGAKEINRGIWRTFPDYIALDPDLVPRTSELSVRFYPKRAFGGRYLVAEAELSTFDHSLKTGDRAGLAAKNFSLTPGGSPK